MKVQVSNSTLRQNSCERSRNGCWRSNPLAARSPLEYLGIEERLSYLTTDLSSPSTDFFKNTCENRLLWQAVNLSTMCYSGPPNLNLQLQHVEIPQGADPNRCPGHPSTVKYHWARCFHESGVAESSSGEQKQRINIFILYLVLKVPFGATRSPSRMPPQPLQVIFISPALSSSQP